MTNTKRTAQVKSHIPAELREQLELFVAEEGPTVSMSDYLFQVIEQHVAYRSSLRRGPIRASQQKSLRRVGEA